MAEEIQAATSWPTNAALLADVHVLGYLTDEMLILDATAGREAFWRCWRPPRLVCRDILDGSGWNYEAMDYDDASFDAVVLDPPYRLTGGAWEGRPDFEDRYGLGPRMTWQERHASIKLGIGESVRVCRPRGYVLVKCQNQVCSGFVRWQTREFADHAESLGCRLVDTLHILGGSRPQPAGRAQLHARQNYSTLLILKKGRPNA